MHKGRVGISKEQVDIIGSRWVCIRNKWVRISSRLLWVGSRLVCISNRWV